MPDVCVVHLVRAKNGPEPFWRFLESYAQNPGGLKHDLVIAFKGRFGKAGLREYYQRLEGFPHRCWFISDFGYDIRPYFLATEKFGQRYFCFLNSNSVLLDKDWLALMYGHCSEKGVGLVGATGSYASWLSDFLNMHERLRSLPHYQGFSGRLKLRLKRRIYQRDYDPFPNYHLRTNAFMISRDVARRIERGRMLTKWDAFRFESGKDGLTKQILRMNLRIQVVGKDGKAYEIEEWPRSNTFWQGDQGNLLVADKQTKRYSESDPSLRQHLTRTAWGILANPPLC